MAGSYGHVTDKDGDFRRNEDFYDMVENMGDAYETIEHLWVMVQVLANRDKEVIQNAVKEAYKQMNTTEWMGWGQLPERKVNESAKNIG